MKSPIAVFSFPRSGRGFLRACYHGSGKTYGYEDLPEFDLYQEHDFALDRESQRPNLVLARDPVECMASWFKLDCANGGRSDSEANFWNAVDESADYWRGFADKHILSGRCPVAWFWWIHEDPQAFIRLVESISGDALPNRVKLNPPTRHKDFPYYANGGADRLRERLEPQYSKVIDLGGPFA